MNATASDLRARFLRDRVLTATPAQRVVMLYDRLLLDITQGSQAEDNAAAGPHLSHAMLVVAELQASLDLSAGGPADNLAQIYGYLLRQLIEARTGSRDLLPGLTGPVWGLRDSWATAIEQLSGESSDREPRGSAPGARQAAPAGAWVS